MPLNLLKKFFIDSQLFVSLCGTLLATFFMLHSGKTDLPLLFLIFFTFWNGYLYTKFQHSKYFYKALILNGLFGIVSLLIIYLYSEISFMKWVVIVILGLFYNSKFLENAVREIPLLKVFYVGLTWALVCSWLILPKFSPAIFVISWLFVTALVLPFDIRDMRDDDVITFPKKIGVQNTKYFAYMLIFSTVMISIFYLKPEFSLAFSLASALAFIFIYFSETDNGDLYFSFWVELCSALPLIFLMALKFFT